MYVRQQTNIGRVRGAKLLGGGTPSVPMGGGTTVVTSTVGSQHVGYIDDHHRV